MKNRLSRILYQSTEISAKYEEQLKTETQNILIRISREYMSSRWNYRIVKNDEGFFSRDNYRSHIRAV